MKNTIVNRGVIKKIALALGELNERVVYVGGAVVSLYADDPAADDVRPTKDIDISMQIASLAELEEIREALAKKGFKQTHEDNVVCRFRYDDIMVDVMATKAIGWAPANEWFAPGFEHLEKIVVEDAEIHILPLTYFLATKFAAYYDRGKNEPRTSHDFEDIAYILDNQTQLAEKINSAPSDVKTYLQNEIQALLKNTQMLEAIEGNLFYETRQKRFDMLLDKLRKVIN